MKLYCGINVDKLKLIGEGTQGKVYLLTPNKVIKVFKKKKSCKDQLDILLNGQKSKFFTTIYDYDEDSIIMEFLPGEDLKKYLKKNKLTKEIALQLVEIFRDFKMLGFKRVDIRLLHIFLQPDKSLKVIDPRKSYIRETSYPKSMLRGLDKLNMLEDFWNFIKEKYPNEYSEWKYKFDKKLEFDKK
ncbi:serine/threonine protein kinase [Clostridium sp. B9]|uniref:serine/threonine protein kinase n=1 Tax=Clostridium sp. B9 TaxID=3423224 RepID=UPI003D2EA722